MVPLPDHLLPLEKRTDSDGMSSQDFLKKEMMKDEKRQHLMPIKRLEDKNNQAKVMERNAADARFLDGLFNDKISEDSERAEE